MELLAETTWTVTNIVLLLGALASPFVAYLGYRQAIKIKEREIEAKKAELNQQAENERLKAGVSKGEQLNDAQKQQDIHDENLLEKFLIRIDKLETKLETDRAAMAAALSSERKECDEKIGKIADKHDDCMKLHADAMRKIGQLESKTNTNTEKIVSVSNRHHADNESVIREVAEIKAKVESVNINAPPPPMSVETLNVEAKNVDVHTENKQ